MKRFFPLLGLALFIAAALYFAGEWTVTFLIALGVVLLIGAVFPPLAYVVLIIAAVYIVFTQGLKILARVQSFARPVAKKKGGKTK